MHTHIYSILVYIYIYSFRHILNYQSTGRTKLFFPLVTRKSVQNINGILGVSQGNKNCIICENVTKCNSK